MSMNKNMENVDNVSTSPASNAGNPRKRNLLFLTGNKKTCLPNSVRVLSSSDCEITMDSDTRADAEKRKVVSGRTINIDISEKIEIRLGQIHKTNIKEVSNNFEDEEKFKEDCNDGAKTKKRKLPDLKPISGTLLVMSRSNERLNENCPNSNSTSELIHTNTVSNAEESPSKRRRIAPPNAINSRRTKWKCKKCSFQHALKEEVVLHVRSAHKQGENNDVDVPIDSKAKDDLTGPHPNGGNSPEIAEKNLGKEEVVAKKEDTRTNEPQTLLATRGVGSKAYGCEACPYTTGCKSQFINHARFHRPSNGDFKCKYCTYNVTHKHLLLQHVRVHGVYDISSENVTDAKSNIDGTQYSYNGSQNKNESPGLLFSPKVNKANGMTRKIGMMKSTETLMAHRKINEIKQYNLMKSRELTKTTIHLCNECPARFFEERQLKTHNNFHSTNFKMKCNFCSYSSVQKEHLASHMKVHSKVYQFKTRKLLSICAQARQYPVQKQRIGESAPRLNSVNDNIKSNYTMSASNTNDSVIYCEKCPSKFFSGILYRQHSVYHGKQTSHKCGICNFGTDTNTELAIHKLIHAGSDIEITKGNHWMKFGVFVKNENVVSPQTGTGNRAKYYKCNKCPFEFSKRDRYELHLKQHGSNQKYTCTICDFSVNLYVNYVQHLKKHDSNSVFDGTIAKTDCDGFLAESENARSIVQTQTQLYKCDICPFYAVDEKTVSLHKQKHETPANKSTLTSTAEETLNATATYACPYCDFITSSNDLLQDHEELHTALSENQTLFDEDNDNTNPDTDENLENLSICNDNDLDLSNGANNESSGEDTS